MHVLSLEYHDVVVGDPDETGFPGAGPASYKLDRLVFEAHLDEISRAVPDPPACALDLLQRTTSGRPLLLTFDDGGRSAVSGIADALERYGWCGHFFVTGNAIGTPTFLSPSETRALRDRGHIIGSHSMTHPARMGACSEQQLADEWKRSTDLLSNIIGEPVVTASVPGGFYTKKVATTAAATGIRILFTSAPTTRCHTVDGCLILGRYTIRRWTKASTAATLASGGLFPRLSQWMLYSGLNMVRAAAGDHYTHIRQLFWARQRI
jgi:peptidoglycan/xylan/chitin deacetylase (PgdA/CDA1 family)